MVGYRLCSAQPLAKFGAQVFRALGADEDVAAEVANHLVRSNLSGHDSHGVIRIAQYVAQADNGEVIPSARPTILREGPSTAVIDANRGLGLYTTAFALDWAMEHARRHGVAVAAIRHSTHIGRVGEYAERAAGRGLIAMVTVGACGPGVGGMVLFGGRQRFFGANPWAIGVPARGRPPAVFDGSTSTVAEGKVRVARAKGAQLPPGCIIDREGNPTTNPDDFYAGGALVPLGGDAAGHKGYGLALMSALLSGLATIDDDNPTLIGASIRQEVADARGRMAGVFLVAVDPAWFGDRDLYEGSVSETLAAAKRVPPAQGVPEVLVPGELEVKNRESRIREGIALPEATWKDLARVAERFGLTMPEGGLV